MDATHERCLIWIEEHKEVMSPNGCELRAVCLVSQAAEFEAMAMLFDDRQACPDEWHMDLASLPFYANKSVDSELVTTALRYAKAVRGIEC